MKITIIILIKGDFLLALSSIGSNIVYGHLWNLPFFPAVDKASRAPLVCSFGMRATHCWHREWYRTRREKLQDLWMKKITTIKWRENNTSIRLCTTLSLYQFTCNWIYLSCALSLSHTHTHTHTQCSVI